MFLGVHDYDVVRWYTGQEVDRVSAEVRYGVLRAEGQDVEDSAWALLHFAGGAIGCVDSCWVLPPSHPGFEQRLEVIGTRGSLTLEAGYQGLLISGPSGTRYLDNGLWPRVHGRRGGALAGEWDHFLTCIREGRTPLITVDDGLAAVRIATAVQQAADSHQVVHLDGHPGGTISAKAAPYESQG